MAVAGAESSKFMRAETGETHRLHSRRNQNSLKGVAGVVRWAATTGGQPLSAVGGGQPNAAQMAPNGAAEAENRRRYWQM